MPRIAVDDVEPDPTKPTPVEPVRPVEVKPQPHVLPYTSTDSEIENKSEPSKLFAAFTAFPKGITFSGETDNEDIVLLLRAHIITNLPWVLLTIGALLFPVILLPILSAFGLPSVIGGGGLVTFILFWYVGTFTFAFLNFLYWYFNVYIVTNERVVDVDWYGVLYKKVSATQISKIQDVHASQGGVFAGVFDYGDVEIQTAGTEINFEFTAVPHPQLVSKKIQEFMEAEELEWETNPQP